MHGYFSWVEIDLNLAFKLVPSPLRTVIIATEMPAAIRPYSMAVAPDSSFKKALHRSCTVCSRIGGKMLRPKIQPERPRPMLSEAQTLPNATKVGDRYLPKVEKSDLKG